MKDSVATPFSEDPELALTKIDLSAANTRMSADRSLMSWVRTGLSLVSFGFTIYKFLEYSKEQTMASGKTSMDTASPEMIGLFMIGVGILCFVLGIIENLTITKVLRSSFHGVRLPRYALFMALVLIVLSGIIFLGIFFKVRGIS